MQDKALFEVTLINYISNNNNLVLKYLKIEDVILKKYLNSDKAAKKFIT